MGYMGWENVTATGYVPPAIPFAVDWKLEIENVQGPGTEDAIGTPASAAEALARWRTAGDSIGGDVASGDPGETVTITPADPRALTTSEVLPPSVWQDTPSIGEDNVAGAAGASVAATGDVLADIGTGQGGDATQAANPWFFFPPFMTLGFMRYNPVEGVSTGTQLRRDFGWWRSALSVRIATRSLAVPDIDFTLQRDHPGRRIQISLYRALRGGALGIGGSTGGRATSSPRAIPRTSTGREGPHPAHSRERSAEPALAESLRRAGRGNRDRRRKGPVRRLRGMETVVGRTRGRVARWGRHRGRPGIAR